MYNNFIIFQRKSFQSFRGGEFKEKQNIFIMSTVC